MTGNASPSFGALLCLVFAATITGFQLLLYLRTGLWPSLSVLDAYQWLMTMGPIQSGQISSAGIRQMLDFIPLVAIAVILAGILWKAE